ncbi:hypothetical protein ThidrDRAFT_1217 [Thiorhodococcus drewsii AZ1]|uniref:Uncharacterized protein n=1 Tax=Thiorhodococcus drewsii AZ1 TaxID=765913 RepID=G2DZ14_9GAMM|nr:hypothetical protein [Thiorhodococcus drewsii]EGV32368.1 hypothetical protein ThidrDRAFT_1217 [Thiorhodococcus drewsii AZ1]
MKSSVIALLAIGLIGSGVSGGLLATQYGPVLKGDEGIWWTPDSSPLSLDETASAFRLYIDNTSLQAHMQNGSLTGLGREGLAFHVEPKDVAVLVNNWPSVRAAFLQSALYSAFALGASLSCLLIGIVAAFRGAGQARSQARRLR